MLTCSIVCKLILEIKIVLYRLNNIRLKEQTAHAHLNPSVGPHSIDMFDSLIGSLGFTPFTIKKKHNIIFVLFQKSVFKCACTAKKELRRPALKRNYK